MFNISEKESQELSELVKEYQTHYCDDVLCDLCSSPELPSLDTLLPEASSRANFETSTKLLHQIKENLKGISIDQKKTLSSYSWLDHVMDDMTGEITEDNKLLKITYHQENFEFEVDETLSSFLEKYSTSPFIAAYH